MLDLGFYTINYVYDTETKLYYLQSRYYDPELGRFINADAYASTGQGVLGNNMFAYCNNNPVISFDISGTVSRICINEDTRLSEQPWRDFSPGGGGSRATGSGIYAPDYGSVADKFYTVRALRFVGTQISNLGHKLRDAYTQGYKMYHEAKILEAHLMIDMFDTPKDIERSIDIITSTVGLEYAIYELVKVSIVNPTVGAIGFTVWGVIVAARELYRATN